MTTHRNTLPELDQRLQEERSAVAQTVDVLHQRVRDDIKDLSPKQQLKRHPGAALAVTVAAGFIAGRIVGRVLAGLLQ